MFLRPLGYSSISSFIYVNTYFVIETTGAAIFRRRFLH